MKYLERQNCCTGVCKSKSDVCNVFHFRLCKFYCARLSATRAHLSWSGGFPPFQISQTCTYSTDKSQIGKIVNKTTNLESIEFDMKLSSYYTFQVTDADGTTIQKDFPIRYVIYQELRKFILNLI